MGRGPMGRERKRRSTLPATAPRRRDPQAEQRQVSGSWPRVKIDLPPVVGRADVPVAPDAERVIQQAGGHADLPLWSPCNATPSGISMSALFNPGARFRRMNRKSSWSTVWGRSKPACMSDLRRGAQRVTAYSGSRLHDAQSGVPEPAEDVLGA